MTILRADEQSFAIVPHSETVIVIGYQNPSNLSVCIRLVLTETMRLVVTDTTTPAKDLVIVGDNHNPYFVVGSLHIETVSHKKISFPRITCNRRPLS